METESEEVSETESRGDVGMNCLYYGNNLSILREDKDFKDESIDLIYLDPPFNSQASYNILFRSPAGEQSPAQIEAFEDSWHWTDEAEKAFDEVMMSGSTDAAEMLRAMRSFLKENDMMAYLTMMAVRLLELHRVLKPTGSLYLHCDPTASHYLKIVLDVIFGPRQFRNDIIWKRVSTVKGNFGQGSKFFGPNIDDILFYAKSDEQIFNPIFSEYSEEYLEKFYKYEDPDGRRYRLISMIGPGGAAKGNPYYEVMGVSRFWRYSIKKMQDLIDKELVVQTNSEAVPQRKQYLDEGKGVAAQSLWEGIEALSASSAERLGYPTQKPLALLQWIIQASSNEGDIVLDPFCGCGTTIHAAQKLRRQWIGIDITHLAISLIEKRLNDAFPGITYEVRGTPKDLDGARALAAANKYQFQWWAVSLVNAVPFGGTKKGADTGIDGLIYFKPDGKTTEKAVVSVKGGENVGVAMIRDLAHVVDREKAKIGIFITLTESTGPMRTEAIKAGYYDSPVSGKIPKIQILTIEELFAGRKPHIPLVDMTTFKKAKREDRTEQGALWGKGS
jgi:adenine specific DNA methylase Mod